MKKLFRILLVSSLIGLLILAAGCGNKKESKSSTEQKKPVKVQFGLDTAAGASYQFRVAAAKGYFQKYGIEPEISNYAWGIDTMNAVLIGKAETSVGADYALLNTIGKGDLKIASLLTLGNTKWSALFARDKITKPEDLKGKRLGVQKGTVYEYIWTKYLENNGIDSKDVEFKAIQTPAESAAALERGEIDAAWFNGAFIAKAQNIKGAKQLSDLTPIDFKIRGFFLVSGNLAKKTDVVANILKALDEANTFIKQNPEETAEILFKEIKLPKEDVLKEITQDPDKYQIGFTQDDYDHLANIKEWSTAKGILKEKYDLKDKIAIEPLKKALPKKATYKP